MSIVNKVYVSDLMSSKYRDDQCPDNAWPCLLCGRPVTSDKAVWVLIGEGNSRFIHPDEDLEDIDDVGAFPIGSECFRRRRKILQQFVKSCA